jgi:ketosteroid isomerase-like protein
MRRSDVRQRMSGSEMRIEGLGRSLILSGEINIRDLIDEREIRNTLSRYWRGVDRLDLDLMASAFHADAVDHHAGKDRPAHEFVRAALDRMPQVAPGGTQHRVTNISIELDGDKAWSEAYFHAIHNADDRLNELFGRYVDRFERRDGKWKIAERWSVVDFSQSAPRTALPSEKNPDTHRGRRDRTDVSYFRDRPQTSS